jgi:antitoxin VapB
MQTARIFTNGNSQAVRLPKEFRFEDEEVIIKKVGDMVILFPKRYSADILKALLGDWIRTSLLSGNNLKRQKNGISIDGWISAICSTPISASILSTAAPATSVYWIAWGNTNTAKY